MKRTAALLFCFFIFGGVARASVLAPGVYERGSDALYIGVEHELPDSPENEFFDPQTQHTGALTSSRGLHLRAGLREERRVIVTPQGRLGVSLYFAGTAPRTTVLLVHGNDPETREMGFIIPYFVGNGVNVISYDQRGTGDSTGNWFLNGPVQRAQDATAIYDAFRNDPHVDAHRIGIWGFSNGGWTAPIVSLKRPLAFMILKSAPAESLLSNIDYEVVEMMRRHGESPAATEKALTLWHTVENALYGKTTWSAAKRVYDSSAAQPWFQHSLMLEKMAIPPPEAMADGLRRAISYDPVQTLTQVRTPTLAVFGALDRNLDSADSSIRMRQYFERAGNRDFTIHTYANAGHQLKLSKTGYNGDATLPERYVAGYPQIMLDWLTQRGLRDTAM